MDFSYTEQQQKLRKELHEFFIKELPSDHQVTVQGIDKETQAFELKWQREFGGRGWLTPSWPKEYGGLGVGAMEGGVIFEESEYWLYRFPNNVGLHLVCPALFLFGTEEQKKKYIPPQARGEHVWFECFTEPNAGSDEANVQLKAVPDGNDYVLNGQKMFNGSAYKPDYLLVLARTSDEGPKHRGLTLFIVPGDTPGVTYGALPVMGDHHSNELFFDNVRVPKANILGGVNQGFYGAMKIFEFERTGVGRVATYRRVLEEFVEYCKKTERDGKPLIEDPMVRDALARMAIGVEVWRLAAWYSLWRFSERERLGPAGYDLTGLYAKRVPTYHAKAMMDIMGLYGQLRAGSKYSEMGGKVDRSWQRARSLHAGGTIEIYKNVLSQRALGLPRRPRAKPQV